MNPLVRLAIGLVLVAAIFIVASWADLHHHVTIEGMRELLDSWGSLGPGVFVLLTGIALFVSFPATVLLASGGMLYGSLWGFVYGWLAAMLGSMITFATARTFARSAVQTSFGSRFAFRRLDEHFERSGFWTVLLLRAVLCVAPPLNWAMGATSVRSRDHLAGTALGIVPELYLVVVLGDSLAEAAGSDSYLTPGVIIPAVLLTVVLAIAAVVGRRLLSPDR